MKILVLNPILFTSTDGSLPKVETIKDTMMYGMCLGFKNLGHEVTLVSYEEYKPTMQETYDFEVLFLKSSLAGVLPNALPLSMALRGFLKELHKDFDMVLSSEVFAFHSLFAARICPEKTIIWQELTEHQNKMRQLPSKFWHSVVARLWMQNVKAVVPRSTKAYGFISRYMPMTTTTVVDHGINVEKFQSRKEKKRQIISSSQLIHRKNVDGIIRIFADFHREKGYEDVRLLIAGRGEEEEKLKGLVKDLGMEDFVTFLGFLPQAKLNEYIRESMCFLVNTRKDLNMVSIPESIVSGTPILTNMQPASARYIAEEQLGIAKDEWSVEDLKAMIDHNNEYVARCLAYRDRLTNTHSAEMLTEIFRQ